jgi:predicted nucleotidyltransferase
MKRNLLNLSGKIDSLTVELFETISDVAEFAKVPFFVVGATARDMILVYGYDIKTIRATHDIDFAVQVSDWSQYTKLIEGLLETGKFRSKREIQRLTYKETLDIDIIPFGAISDQDNSFSWPPDNEIKMSILGFEEAYQTSITVRMREEPILDIKFVSLPGLALLKIISWNDNNLRRDKDAKDLLLLMRTYLEAGNHERLFNEHMDLVEVEDFDYVRAGSRLLGRDIGYCQLFCVKFLSANFLKKGRFCGTFPMGFDRHLTSIFRQTKANRV